MSELRDESNSSGMTWNVGSKENVVLADGNAVHKHINSRFTVLSSSEELTNVANWHACGAAASRLQHRNVLCSRNFAKSKRHRNALMINMLASVWALLLGIVLIMLGNGMHFTLMGLRGGIEGFSSAELSIVTSGYFLGFLSGARYTPVLIQRVGHVRVFAALGSFISAALIAFTLWAEPWSWTVLRIIIGFCMSGVYVVAESWLNNATTNENRGKMLSAYMLAQTLGIIGAQGLLTLGNAANAALFIGASILVSISFAPILLSIQPRPLWKSPSPAGSRTFLMPRRLALSGYFYWAASMPANQGWGRFSAARSV